jgi:hypothetical protein
MPISIFVQGMPIASGAYVGKQIESGESVQDL